MKNGVFWKLLALPRQFHHASVIRKPCREVAWRQWLAEEVTLGEFASVFTQDVKMASSFDAFRDDLEPKCVTHLNGLEHHYTVVPFVHVHHKRTVNLKGDLASLKAAVDSSLEETVRMFTAVARMRAKLAHEDKVLGKPDE